MAVCTKLLPSLLSYPRCHAVLLILHPAEGSSGESRAEPRRTFNEQSECSGTAQSEEGRSCRLPWENLSQAQIRSVAAAEQCLCMGGGAGGAQCVPAHLQRGSGRVGGPPSSIVSLAAIAASAAAALSLGKPRAAQLQRSWERNVLLLWLLARIGTRPGAKRKGELLS